MMKVAAFSDDAGSGRFLRGGGARTETPSAVRGGTGDAVADEDVAQCSERKGTLVAICIASKSINDDDMPPTHATHVETHATRRKQQQRRDASARHRVASSRNSLQHRFLKASTPHTHPGHVWFSFFSNLVRLVIGLPMSLNSHTLLTHHS